MTEADASHDHLATIRPSAGSIVALGVLQVVIGLLAIGCPLITGVAIAYLVGALLLLGGVVQIVFSTRAGKWGAGLMAALGGLVAIIAGAVMIAHPIFGLGFLTLLLIVFFAVDGISRIVVAMKMRPRPGWGWALFCGAITTLLAMLIWMQWPVSGAWAIGTLVGIQMLFVGWAHVALGMAAKRGSQGEPASA